MPPAKYIRSKSRWGYGIVYKRVHGVECEKNPPCFHCDVHGGNIPRCRVDTDKRSAVDSGETKNPPGLYCTKWSANLLNTTKTTTTPKINIITYNFLQLNHNLQLSIRMEQTCLSKGYFLRSILQLSVTDNLK